VSGSDDGLTVPGRLDASRKDVSHHLSLDGWPEQNR
jgi:hypothetical protein